MIHFFSFLIHTKVAKIVLSGEPDHFQALWHLAEGLFSLKNIFKKKKDF